MVHKALSGCVIVTAGTGEKDWNNQRIKEWIINASGRFERAITDDTTHLVVTKKLWTAAGPLVQDVVARKKSGQNIKVVTQDWLEDSLQAKSKKKEKEYQFSVPGFNGKEDANGNPRSHTGLLKELYLENTELTPAQEKRNLKQQQMEDDLEKERLAEREAEIQKHISASMSVPEQAAIFKKGAQKAKSIVGSNHHLYVDQTGFTYDVMLTKVDTKHNSNERYNLIIQIFESNAMPHTYALTTTFSGTKVVQQQNNIVGIGANLPTVLRAFRNAFKEQTGIDWHDRINVAHERALREHELKRMKKAGLPIQPQETEDIRFQKFKYYPPAYGSVGELNTPTSQQDEEEIAGQDYEAPQPPRSASRSQTPVRAEFDANDLARFNEAQLVENEAGEKLDPMAAPYDFGQSQSFDELIAPAGAEEGQNKAGATPAGEDVVETNGATTQYGGATQYMDFSTYDDQHAYASPPPEPNSEQPVQNGHSTLAKRKDSPADERSEQEIKKQKFNPETGDYIIEQAVDDEDGA